MYTDLEHSPIHTDLWSQQLKIMLFEIFLYRSWNKCYVWKSFDAAYDNLRVNVHVHTSAHMHSQADNSRTHHVSRTHKWWKGERHYVRLSRNPGAHLFILTLNQVEWNRRMVFSDSVIHKIKVGLEWRQCDVIKNRKALPKLGHKKRTYKSRSWIVS